MQAARSSQLCVSALARGPSWRERDAVRERGPNIALVHSGAVRSAVPGAFFPASTCCSAPVYEPVDLQAVATIADGAACSSMAQATAQATAQA